MAWLRAVDRRWDVVPVVIQDPVWESSFPDVGGVLVPFVDAGSGGVRRVRMGRREARRLRAAHEERHAALIDTLTAYGTDPVVVSSADPDAILTAFLGLGRRPSHGASRRPMRRLAVGIVLALAGLAGAFPGVAGAVDTLSLQTSLTPRTALFADPVAAGLQVVVDSAVSARVRVVADFSPYRVVGPVEVERTEGGQQTELRWIWHLECLTRACLPGPKQRRVLFAPAKVIVPITGRAQTVTTLWPALTVRSRLAPEDRARPVQRATIYPLGATSNRIKASTLERLLWIGVGALVLAAGALLVPLARRIPRPRRRFDRLSSAERALVLARRASARDDPGRRRTALERLGRELARRGSPDLADEATRMAWAESPPIGDAMTGLVGRAEQALKGTRLTTSTIPLADTSDLCAPDTEDDDHQARAACGGCRLAAACVVSVGRLEVAATTVLGPGTSGVIVLDLSSSTESAPPREIPGLLRHLANAGGHTGLVLFSDVAYEALPLGTRSEELRPFLRYFRRPPAPAVPVSAATPPSARPLTPWSRSFRSGTRISAALASARRMVSPPPQVARTTWCSSAISTTPCSTSSRS